VTRPKRLTVTCIRVVAHSPASATLVTRTFTLATARAALRHCSAPVFGNTPLHDLLSHEWCPAHSTLSAFAGADVCCDLLPDPTSHRAVSGTSAKYGDLSKKWPAIHLHSPTLHLVCPASQRRGIQCCKSASVERSNAQTLWQRVFAVWCRFNCAGTV
jgi:hypothetical protein